MTASPYHLYDDERLAQIDGLRGIAALGVVVFHFFEYFFSAPGRPSGYLFVDLFFILSGFIIARHYEERVVQRQLRFRDFALIRLGRLYPMYIVGLFLCIAFAGAFAFDNSSFRYNFFSWALFGSVIFTPTVSWNWPSWSVPVEFWVNMLFFVAARFFGRIHSLILIAAIVLCVVSLSMWGANLNLITASPPLFNPPMLRGVAGFCMGMLIWRIYPRLPIMPYVWLRGLELLLLTAMFAFFSYGSALVPYYRDYVYVFMVFPLLLCGALYKASITGWLCSRRPLAVLGTISYSLYCLQLPLHMAMEKWIKTDRKAYPLEEGVLYLLLLLVISFLSWKYLENPLRQLSKRFILGRK